MTCKGVVKGNTIILEEGVHLPDGVTVSVTVELMKQVEVVELTPEEKEDRQILVARMKEFGQRLVGRNVSLGDLILEGREELESRARLVVDASIAVKWLNPQETLADKANLIRDDYAQGCSCLHFGITRWPMASTRR